MLQRLNNLRIYSISNFSDKISIVKGGDVKNFGKKFSPQEMEKYLDPFGFLAIDECNYYMK